MNQPSEEEVGLSSIGELINFFGGIGSCSEPEKKNRMRASSYFSSYLTYIPT